MIKNLITSLTLTLSLIFGISTAGKASVFRLIVKEELASCTGVAPQTCFQVKYTNSTDWELFYSEISGFKYQPGYRYELLVSRTKRANVPADASAYTYKLKRIVKKTKMPAANTEWGFVLRHKWKLIQMNGITQEQSPVYMTFDGTKKRVGGKSGCNSFFGGYENKAGQLKFAQMAGTMMACSEELNKLEHQFLTLIGNKTFRYDVADQVLNLYEGDKLVLMFGMAPLDK
ncbi:DUF4377 domain-containing protein [Pedobacter frigoris]|uniref:DUF4377 domain-containing protein n=1 Tax=Pedobacter frigoris TaxID=2571272 RepID=UPI00292EFDAA|nr:DUF4377 domain-containing protein [Pedobacter frigoris]